MYIITIQHPSLGKCYFTGFDHGGARFSDRRDHRVKGYKRPGDAKRQLSRIKSIKEISDKYEGVTFNIEYIEPLMIV